MAISPCNKILVQTSNTELKRTKICVLLCERSPPLPPAQSIHQNPLLVKSENAPSCKIHIHLTLWVYDECKNYCDCLQVYAKFHPSFFRNYYMVSPTCGNRC